MTQLPTTEAAVNKVGALLHLRIGLRSEGTLRGRLLRSILDEAAVHGDDPATYAERLCRGDEGLEGLVNRVTVQETGFFRHPEHFDLLATSILPRLDRPVTLWSAACANGQEAYSLAMLLEEQGIPGSVVATDLSSAALARTAAAWYSTNEIRGLSPARRHLHLAPEDGGFRVRPAVRARVTSSRHNLIDAIPGQVRACQVVFCRNVLIYLSAEHARAFLNRLADVLMPGAYLFLGAAESLWQVSDRFQAERLGGTFVYRRRAPGSGPAIPQVTPPRPLSRATIRRQPLAPRARPDVVAPRPDAELDQTALSAESGKRALAAGDHAAAVVSFRKWVYLAPENPMGPFHLGLALEAGGHLMSAQRAFAVARAVLTGAGAASVEQALEGFAKDELLKLLTAKQGSTP